MTCKIVRYALWTLTLIAVYWTILLISAVVGSKGVDQLRKPIRATED